MPQHCLKPCPQLSEGSTLAQIRHWMDLERLREPLIRFLRHRGASTDEAEDLAGETLAKLANKCSLDRDRLRPFAYVTAKHLQANEYRRRRREARAVRRYPPPSTLPPHDATICEVEAVRAALRQAAGCVTEAELRVLTLTADGHDHSTIADRLGITTRASQVTLSRARRKLRP